jgi:predicted ferric reductase
MTTLTYVLLVIAIIDIVLLGWSLIYAENLKIFFGTFVFLILICACIYMLPNKNPSELYQEKVEAVEKANKELEKFLIDYPEFREK